MKGIKICISNDKVLCNPLNSSRQNTSNMLYILLLLHNFYMNLCLKLSFVSKWNESLILYLGYAGHCHRIFENRYCYSFFHCNVNSKWDGYFIVLYQLPVTLDNKKGFMVIKLPKKAFMAATSQIYLYCTKIARSKRNVRKEHIYIVVKLSLCYCVIPFYYILWLL